MMWLFIGLVVAISRFLLPSYSLQPADIFKDIAHLYVGGLFGAWFATNRKCYRNMALFMTAVEIIAVLT